MRKRLARLSISLLSVPAVLTVWAGVSGAPKWK